MVNGERIVRRILRSKKIYESDYSFIPLKDVSSKFISVRTIAKEKAEWVLKANDFVDISIEEIQSRKEEKVGQPKSINGGISVDGAGVGRICVLIQAIKKEKDKRFTLTLEELRGVVGKYRGRKTETPKTGKKATLSGNFALKPEWITQYEDPKFERLIKLLNTPLK